ncbi:MAG: hypothetical protein AB8B99_05030 [Phormidesmis sp.]
MNIQTLKVNLKLVKGASVLGASLMGAGLVAIASAQAQTTVQTTETGRTLQELQTSADSETNLSLQELRDRAAALEIERNSRERNSTGNAADSPTIETSATGGNDAVLARLNAESGKATVLLMNNTGAEVTYEAIGQTPPRILAPDESVRLDALPMPVTITAERQNFGLVDMVVSVSDAGTLTVDLERSEFDEVQGALRIREDGYVFVN